MSFSGWLVECQDSHTTSYRKLNNYRCCLCSVLVARSFAVERPILEVGRRLGCTHRKSRIVVNSSLLGTTKLVKIQKMDAPNVLKKVLVTAKGGTLLRCQHNSTTIGLPMTFSMFLPSEYKPNTPVLYWLSGLTCDDTNFAIKAGPKAFTAAEDAGVSVA